MPIASSLAPQLGEPHSSLGEILEYRGRWEEARESFRRGIALSPRYATGHQWYSYDLMAWGQWHEATREMERARELDPLSFVIVLSLGNAYDLGDRTAEAASLYDQADALYPNHPLTATLRFNHDLLLGHMDQAVSDYQRLLALNGVDSAKAADVGRQLRDPAMRVAAFRREAADSTTSPYVSVMIHRTFNGDDSVIAFLDRLAKGPQRDQISPGVLNGALSPKLLANPRMQEVMMKLGYPRLQEEPR